MARRVISLRPCIYYSISPSPCLLCPVIPSSTSQHPSHCIMAHWCAQASRDSTEVHSHPIHTALPLWPPLPLPSHHPLHFTLASSLLPQGLCTYCSGFVETPPSSPPSHLARSPPPSRLCSTCLGRLPRLSSLLMTVTPSPLPSCESCSILVVSFIAFTAAWPDIVHSLGFWVYCLIPLARKVHRIRDL